MKEKLNIIFDGDSWVFGCEIVDPELSKKLGGINIHPGQYDYLTENDFYRIKRIFPTYLGELLNANIENISWPADDNTTILNRTIVHITNEYLSKNKPVDNLLIVVGWSSPERNSFWYKDDKISNRFRLLPNVPHFDTKEQEKFWEIYVSYLWNVEEYLPRYVMNVLQLQNFCNSHNIKWLCFNSFYQTPSVSPKEWIDLDVKNELIKLKDFNSLHGYQKSYDSLGKKVSHQYEYVSLWDTIDTVRFYKKDQEKNTFKSFMEKRNEEPIYFGWHPSPNSHKLWAEELYEYIIKNKILE